MALLLPGCSETSSPDLAAAMPLESSASGAKKGKGETGPLAPAVEACVMALKEVEVHLLEWVAAVQEQCLKLSTEDQALAAAAATLRIDNEITFLKPSQALRELEEERVPYQTQAGSPHEERLALAGVYQAQRSFAQAQTEPVTQCQWHMVITGIKHKTGNPDADYANRRAVCNTLNGDQIYEARSKAREIIDAINADRVD